MQVCLSLEKGVDNSKTKKPTIDHKLTRPLNHTIIYGLFGVILNSNSIAILGKAIFFQQGWFALSMIFVAVSCSDC